MKTTSPPQFNIKKGICVTGGASVRLGDALFLTFPRSYHDEALYLILVILSGRSFVLGSRSSAAKLNNSTKAVVKISKDTGYPS